MAAITVRFKHINQSLPTGIVQSCIFSAAGYIAGWQAHLEEYDTLGLHSEQGIDRMARTGTTMAFHGTVLTRKLDGSGDAAWGSGNWESRPLYGASGLRGAALLFQVRVGLRGKTCSGCWATRLSPVQHNLGGLAMAGDVPELCWSVAHGVHLSYDLSTAASRDNASWLDVVGTFQRVLLSRLADYRGG